LLICDLCVYPIKIHLHKDRGYIMLNAVQKTFVAATIATLGLATTHVNPAQAASFTVNVDAKTNIFGAGDTTVPTPTVNNPVPGEYGLLPPSISFTAGAGQQLKFSSVTGKVSCWDGAPAPAQDQINGPDGGTCANTNTNIIPVYNNGIPGVIDNNRTMFLMGVFLSDQAPTGNPGETSAIRNPANLPYQTNVTNQKNQSPIQAQLAIPFFIGDGYTDSGLQQIFLVPDTATRLFLGFADAASFQGAPRQYQDNTGSLTANFEIGSATAVPTPAVLPGLIGFGLGIWRKRRQVA
jgi:hypothetical protein